MNRKLESPAIQDNGGSRSGGDRRQNEKPFAGEEKRSGRDRRRGVDRRSGKYWNGGCIERRDAFRKRSEKSSLKINEQPSPISTFTVDA